MKQQFAIQAFNATAKQASPLLWRGSVMLFLGFVLCMIFALFDARTIAGVTVWDKPAKFFLSLSVQAFSLAWAMSLAPLKMRGVRTASWLFVAASIVELSYISFRASRAEASHFNVSTTFAAIMYPLMGLGAVVLVCCSAFIGWRLWQQRASSLMREATGLGLMLGALLGAIIGGILSSFTNHWIGGNMNDVSGLAFFHWSTTGGDLRPAHFIGLHATQGLPIMALTGSRIAVYVAAMLFILCTSFALAQALSGIPLFRV